MAGAIRFFPTCCAASGNAEIRTCRLPDLPERWARSLPEADLPGNAAGRRATFPGAVVVVHAGEPTPWGPETGLKIARSFST
jgi:hypothetical protein